MLFGRKMDKEQTLLEGKKRAEKLSEKAVYLAKLCNDEDFVKRLNRFGDNLKYAKTGTDAKLVKIDHKIECGLDDIKIAMVAKTIEKANKLLDELEQLLLQRNDLK